MKEFVGTKRANLDGRRELTEVVLYTVSLLFTVFGVISSLVESIEENGVYPEPIRFIRISECCPVVGG
jgi:hypothetical protein